MNNEATHISSEYKRHISSIAEIVAEARRGRMFILVDAEGRDNEGDLVIPAQFASADAINFMTRFGGGLVCLAINPPDAERLGLQPMSRVANPRRSPDFTVSIEARSGVTTGISAADRARTIAVAIDPKSGASDIATPGHVFPLIACPGGVLVRAGRTEAATDIAKLAGIGSTGVLCEIMTNSGTLAKLPQIFELADRENLKVGTVADLISYRLQSEKLVRRSAELEFKSEIGGQWHAIAYRSSLDSREHLAVIKGDLTRPGPVLVRMHTLQPMKDVLLASGAENDAVRHAMQIISREGRGAVILLSNQTGFSQILQGNQKPETNSGLREIGIGAQILRDIGISEVMLITNSQRAIVGLEGYGLRICGRISHSSAG